MGELGVGLVPKGRELFDLVGYGFGEIFGFAAVFAEVVEFPVAVRSGGGELPVTGAEAAVSHVVKVDKVAFERRILLQYGE